MALVTDDIDQIEALPKGKIKNLVFDFYHALKKMGYAPHTNIPKTGTKKSIHFYYDENDYKKRTAPYSITINHEDYVTFYFRKTSNNAGLDVMQLEEEFVVGNVTDNREENCKNGELRIRIHDLEKAEHLISQYIPSLN